MIRRSTKISLKLLGLYWVEGSHLEIKRMPDLWYNQIGFELSLR